MSSLSVNSPLYVLIKNEFSISPIRKYFYLMIMNKNLVFNFLNYQSSQHFLNFVLFLKALFNIFRILSLGNSICKIFYLFLLLMYQLLDRHILLSKLYKLWYWNFFQQSQEIASKMVSFLHKISIWHLIRIFIFI